MKRRGTMGTYSPTLEEYIQLREIVNIPTGPDDLVADENVRNICLARTARAEVKIPFQPHQIDGVITGTKVEKVDTTF